MHSDAPFDDVVNTGHPQASASRQLFEKGSYRVGRTKRSAVLYQELVSEIDPRKVIQFDTPSSRAIL